MIARPKISRNERKTTEIGQARARRIRGARGVRRAPRALRALPVGARAHEAAAGPPRAAPARGRRRRRGLRGVPPRERHGGTAADVRGPRRGHAAVAPLAAPHLRRRLRQLPLAPAPGPVLLAAHRRRLRAARRPPKDPAVATAARVAGYPEGDRRAFLARVRAAVAALGSPCVLADEITDRTGGGRAEMNAGHYDRALDPALCARVAALYPADVALWRATCGNASAS